MTWGQAKKKLESSGQYVAMDFYPDLTMDDGQGVITRTIVIDETKESTADGVNDSSVSITVNGKSDDTVGGKASETPTDLEDDAITVVDVKNLPNDWLGLAAMLTVATHEPECAVSCASDVFKDTASTCPKSDVIQSVTKTKSSDNKVILYVGLGLVVMGLILAAYGIIRKKMGGWFSSRNEDGSFKTIGGGDDGAEGGTPPPSVDVSIQ
jgi:hypothetical protein